ncbi:MAG: hypothetical protein ACFUZC_06565 [Chthoniobacteraceae bacterium]
MNIPLFTPLATLLVTATLGLAPVGAQDGPPPDDMLPLPPLPQLDNPGTPAATSGSGSNQPAATRQPLPPLPGGPGSPDSAAFRQRMNERIKTALKASDEEWAVIEPLLEKVMEKQREVMMSRIGGIFGGERRGGGRPGGPEGNNASPVGRPPRAANQPEIEALKSALQNDSISNEEIKAKLEAVRAARKKANAELEAASEDLRKVLSLRQEALLIMMGILQ